MPRSAPLPEEGPPVGDAAGEAGAGVALEVIYRNERHALVRFFTRNRASPEDAQDLTQETFLRLSRLDFGASAIMRPKAYLRQIARNLLRDRVKSAAHRAEQSRVAFEISTLADADEVRRLEARDSLARIEAAMARMKPRTREIFLAHRVHGFSYAEIAAETGLTVKGVEKQMSKAIAQLERLMGGH